MWRYQQIFAGYLTLCLGFAGAVGISPVLHLLIEHGGQGTAHTHPAKTRLAVPSHGHRHGHGGVEPTHRHGPYPECDEGVVAHSHEDDCHALSLQGIWRGLGALLAGGCPDTSDSVPDENDPYHDHNSLPQLLAGGLVEQHVDQPILHHVRFAYGFHSQAERSFYLDRGFDPLTASRPPP